MDKHELITSPYLHLLEEELTRSVWEEKEADALAPVVVMVGSNVLGRYLLRRFSGRGRGLINVRFITLGEMAEVLGRGHLEAEGNRSFPEFLEDALLDEVIGKQELSYFRPMKEFPGFKSAFKATLRDLRDAGLVPDLEKNILPRLSEDLQAKWDDIASIADAFFSAYRDRYYDDAGLFKAAIRGVSLYASRFNTGRLSVYGLYDFTRVQAEMIKALASAASFKVFIPFEEHGKSFAFAGPGRDWYLGIPGMKERHLFGRPDSAGNLARVQEALTKTSGSTGSTPQTSPSPSSQGLVEIIAAPGEVREVEEIAGRIIRLAGEGIPFAGMAVLTRSPEVYVPLVREVFDRTRIPYYIQKGDHRADSPEAMCLLRLLSIIAGEGGRPFFRPRMMEFISCPGVRLPRDPQQEWTADRWRDYSINAGIISGRDDWEEKLGRFIDRSDDPEQRAGASRCREFILRLIDCIMGFPEEGSFGEFANSLQSLLEEFTDFSLPPEVWQGLEILDELMVRADKMRFLNAIGSWLDSKQEHLGRFQEGAVTVGSVMRLRHLRFKAVFVPGVQGRSFPGPAREDPILLDRERKELERSLGKDGAIPRKKLRPSEDRLLFSLITQAAQDRLVLTYSRTDEQGRKERLPSPFLLEAATSITGVRVDYSRFVSGLKDDGKRELVHRVPLSRTRSARQDIKNLEDRPPLTEAEFSLWESARALIKNRPLPAPIAEIHPFFSRGFSLARERRKGSGPYLGRMVENESLALLRSFMKDKSFSAGELEEYARCPFQYLAHRIMKIDPPSYPERVTLEPADRGSLVHGLLRRFMERIEEKDLFPLAARDRGELLRMIEEAFEKECEEQEGKLLWADREQWEFTREELRTELPVILVSLLKSEREDFRPVAFERSFGFGEKEGLVFSSPEPIPLDLPDGETIKLKGRMDRMDKSISGRALRAIDYKTGQYRFTGERLLLSGTALQAPLYLIAAGGILGMEIDDLAESESGYVYVMGGSAGRIKMAGGTDFLDQAKKAVKVIVDGIKSGVFAPLPASFDPNYDVCTRACDCRDVCGFRGGGFFDRLSDDDLEKKLRKLLDEYR